MGFNFFKRRDKEGIFLVLDVGTEAVKVLSCRKENNKTVILGAATQYFERYGVFNGQDFELEVIKKAILKAIVGAEQEAKIKFNRVNKEEWKKWPVLVTLPPDILKAKIIEQTFRQNDPKKKITKKEEKIILEQVFKRAQEEISQAFFKKFGILPKDINWITFNILNIKVDGYSVRGIQGYNGRELKFKILVIFSPKYYFETAQKILEALKLKVSKIIHLTEVVPVVFGKKISDGIFIDVGGRISQIFLLKNGELIQFREIEKGGEIFTQKLSEVLGIDIVSARIFKEKYANRRLSPESEQRIKEIFLEEKRTWSENLDLISSPIFLFGGSSLLPEIRETLRKSKIFYPKGLENIEDTTNNLNVPQYIPSLLIANFIIMPKKFYDIIPPRNKIIQEESPSLKTPTGKGKGAVFFLILLVLAVGIFGLFFFAKIEIEIWPTTELLILEKEITIDPKAEKSDFEKGIFLAKVFETQKSASGEFPATGKFLKKEKARGILTVYNEYSVSSRTLIPSRFISADGKLFWSTKTITIPGATYEKGKVIPGKVEVEVQAAEPGEEYNIGSSTFALPALAGSPSYTTIYAKSFSSMAGGFMSDVSQVTKDDLEKAKNILVEEAKNKGREFLKETLPKEFVLVEETISQQILEVKSSMEAGAEAESFNEQVRVESEGLGFKKSETEEFAREIIGLNIEEGKKFQEKSVEINYSFLNLPSASFLEKVVLGLEIKAKIYSDIDKEGLKKALSGKSLKETKLFLANLKGIERIEIKSWPFFSKKIPEDMDKVNIRLNY